MDLKPPLAKGWATPDLNALLHAGIAAYRQGNYADAAGPFLRILEIEPGHQAARINLANAFWSSKDYSAAALHAAIAVEADPASFQGWVITGAIRLDRGDAGGAIAAYTQAATLRPSQPAGHAGLAAALLAAGDAIGAEREAKAALELAPGDSHAGFTLGCAQLQQRAFDTALGIFDGVIAAVPGHARAWHNRANALIDLNRLDEAEVALRSCLDLDPNLKEAWATLGYLLTIQGRLDDAIAACDRAIALDADFAVGQWNRGVALLLNGDFAAGFAAYEWRKRHPVLKRYFTPLPACAWHGEDLAGRHLLVRAEQGFGDTIMLSRFFPQLAAAAAKLTLCCPPSLFPLFREMDIELMPLDALPAAVDFAVDQMSLPHILQLNEGSIPDAGGYLQADPKRIAVKRIELPGRQRIGLVWAGNAAHDNDRRRSLPQGALAPLLEVAGLSFVSLQIGVRQDEYRIEDGAAAIRDYGDTAAIISELDAVVSVDTSVAHLAGALGVPCHVLLSSACDWRWRLGRDSTPWYDSLRLHRQQRLDDWSGPIASVMECLR